ncbi:MAG: chemotaxis protein CheW [Spirochaetia bacterium]
MSDYLDPNNEELLKDFFSEAQMQVDILEQNILVLENNPSSQDAVDEIFRAAHTLKGASATVQMTELTEFTHVLEDTLDEIRSGTVTVTPPTVDILLNSIDVIKNMLDARSSGDVFSEDVSDLKEDLKNLTAEKAAEPSSKPLKKVPEKAAAKDSSAPSEKALTEYEILEMQEAAEDNESIFSVAVSFDEANPMNTVGGIQVFAALKEAGNILKTDPEFDVLYEDNFIPQVYYYLASSGPAGDIEALLDMPDVITGVEVRELGKKTKEKKAPEKKESEKPVEDPLKEEQEKKEAEKDKKAPRSKEEETKKHSPVGSVLRVDSRRIDNLLNLVSEAVINKATFNQVNSQFTDSLINLQETEEKFRERVRQLFDSLPDHLEKIQRGKTVKEVRKEINDQYSDLVDILDPFEGQFKGAVTKFRTTTQNLDRITGDMQEAVMRIRMVPISQIFSRFPRLVRDLSRSLQKKVNLKIEGEDTELDKSVIEDLLDPLIHCVRNSIDHGIEVPSERKSAGKHEVGNILLKASNEGNMILIEISDDGKGIDVDAVRKKAVDRGLIHPNKALSDIEAFNLIFDPGFSTAKRVTDISGRGVGLDVVKKKIEKLNGSVTIWSEKNKGTKFTIKIPLTLAIIQGLMVRVGKELYAIPITSVLDSHRIKPSEIKMIDNYEVFNVREDVISLLRLNRLFKIPTDEQKDYHFVVVVGSGDKKMGLIVDSLIGEEDVVIKPLRDHYTNAPGIAGANITGDGTVSLIIDVSQLLDLSLRQEIEYRRKREATIK